MGAQSEKTLFLVIKIIYDANYATVEAACILKSRLFKILLEDKFSCSNLFYNQSLRSTEAFSGGIEIGRRLTEKLRHHRLHSDKI